MDQPKVISPTVALVIEQFKAAMSADDTLKDDMVIQIIKVLSEDGTLTAEKFTNAMFFVPEDQEEAKA